MDLFAIATTDINYVAILVATIAAMALGFFWFSPTIFGNDWIKAVGFTQKQIKAGEKTNMLPLLLKNTILTLAGVLTLALFVPPSATWHEGLFLGTIVGTGLITTTMLIHHLYEQRDPTHTLIVAGHTITVFSLIGLILGLF